MTVIKSASVRRDFKAVCDKVIGGDVITVMRPRMDENVVILSEARYSQLEKAEKKANYWAMVNRNLDKIERGETTPHELIED